MSGMKRNYFAKLKGVLSSLEVSARSKKGLTLERAIASIVKHIQVLKSRGNKLILFGNGGSSSIASHIATDFLKNCQIPALTISDSSLLTCLSNDLGYEFVFAKPIEMLAKQGDLVFSISSSGKSKNILTAVSQARKKQCFIITLSGFAKDNPLRTLGDINFYVPSFSYGDVEIAHLAICHYIVDTLLASSPSR